MLLQVQQWAQAERVARSFEMGYSRDYALHRLVVALAQAQQWAQAERVARSFEWEQQAWTLITLALHLILARRWEQAEQVMRSLGKSRWRLEALKVLAQALAQAKTWEQMGPFWATIEQHAETLEGWQKAEVLLVLLQGASRWAREEGTSE
jgi:hypothetical protein